MLDRLNTNLRTALIVLAWIAVGLCFVPWDIWLSRQMIDGLMPGEISGLVHRGEVFGHAYGVMGILITIYVLDPKRRSKLVHVAACYLAAGLTADLIKLQVWRMRPRAYFELGREGSTYLGSIWTTSEYSWLKLVDHTRHSFPSAHTAGAVAVAYSLGRLYPRGRIWFYVLAGLCAMNRIEGGAHYASDVCWGAALGYLIAAHMPSAGRMAGWVAARRRRRPPADTGQRPLSRAA